MPTTRNPSPVLIRRPEAVRLAEQLQKKNPSWSWERCCCEAKQIATSKPNNA